MFQKELNEIKTQIFSKQQELEKLEQLYKNYPDLKKHINREKDMENKNISKLIIKAVQDYFNSIKEAEIDEVDDDVD